MGLKWAGCTSILEASVFFMGPNPFFPPALPQNTGQQNKTEFEFRIQKTSGKLLALFPPIHGGSDEWFYFISSTLQGWAFYGWSYQMIAGKESFLMQVGWKPQCMLLPFCWVGPVGPTPKGLCVRGTGWRNALKKMTKNPSNCHSNQPPYWKHHVHYRWFITITPSLLILKRAKAAFG